MVIIVEGIDRVGKTTLCEMIEERYKDFMDFVRFRDDTRYVHNHLNKEVNTEKINTLQNLLEVGLVDNIILDRYHITEFVYGGIERSYKNMDMYDVDKRLAELIGEGVVLIYVVPTDIRMSSGEHGYNLERHLKWYDDFYKATLIKNKITVDYETLGEALDFIDDLLGIKDSEETEVPGGSTESSEDNEEVWDEWGDDEEL